MRILVILVIALIALRVSTLIVHSVLKALLDREATEGTAQELSAVEVKKRMDTLDELGGHVLRFFVLLIAAVMILGALDLDIGPASPGSASSGSPSGSAPRASSATTSTARLILIENQYSKGDVVSIAGVTGAVEDFSLRRTTLRDLDGVVHTVPNGEVKVASNRTRTWARINQNVTVAFGTDIDKAIQVVDELGRQMAADPVWKRRILEPPRVERVESIDERGITLKILGTVRASEQWAAGGEFRKLLLEAFAKNGIRLPRPPQVVVTRAEATRTASRSAPRPPRTIWRTSVDGPAAPPAAAAPSDDDLADE